MKPRRAGREEEGHAEPPTGREGDCESLPLTKEVQVWLGSRPRRDLSGGRTGRVRIEVGGSKCQGGQP